MPGCFEHHLKLLTIFQEAQRRCKSLCVCWLDLANAFGRVHPDLIVFSLAHYHVPPEMIQLVSYLYDGLTAVISTDKWTTALIHLQLGVTRVTPCLSRQLVWQFPLNSRSTLAYTGYTN